jgi:protein SCO1/2
LLRSWLAATSTLFGAFSPALARDSDEPSATALIEALVTRVQPIGGPFDLIDHTGRRRTDADFHGKLVVRRAWRPSGSSRLSGFISIRQNGP